MSGVELEHAMKQRDVVVKETPARERTRDEALPLPPGLEGDSLARLAHPTAGTHRAAHLRAIQRSRGNAYVQRAVGRAAIDEALADHSHGSPLEPHVRDTFERRLGRELSEVRVHADDRAAQLAGALDANAFTRGSDVYFGAGRYDPSSTSGASLLAHELVHVLQQGAGEVAAYAGALVPPEHATETRAAAVEAPEQGAATPAAPALQRQVAAADAPTAAAAPTAEERIADDLFAGLQGFEEADFAHAIEALRRPGDREAIAQAFRDRHDHADLHAFVKENVAPIHRVQVAALLAFPNGDMLESAALAEDLLALQPNENDVLRILESTPLDRRANLQDDYDRAFNWLGAGSLVDDLKEKMPSRWSREKALTLLRRDLTQADHLYFLSVAIVGVHDLSVVQLVQQLWDTQGPEGIAQLERDWTNLVQRDHPGTDDLRTAIDSELSFHKEAQQLVDAVLDAYESTKDPTAKPGEIAITKDKSKLEAANAAEAQASLTAATTGGWTGAGTNAPQVYRALSELRTVAEQRLARATEALDPAAYAKAQQEWDATKSKLLTETLPPEMDKGSVEYKRSRLLLTASLDSPGRLRPADELWLLGKALDEAGIDRVLTDTWAEGRMDELLADAHEYRYATVDGKEVEIRPSFDVNQLVHGSSKYLIGVLELARPETSDLERGAARLQRELRAGDEESVYRFLGNEHLSGTMRRMVVAQWATKYSGATFSLGEAAAIEEFLRVYGDKTKRQKRYWELRAALGPALPSGEQLVEQAQGQLTAERSGLLSTAFEDPRLAKATDTSLERLKYLQQRASEEELRRAGAELVSEKTPLSRRGVVAAEYSRFQGRLQELDEQKRALAETMATAAEIVAGALLTVATAGAAAGPLIVSLGSVVAGAVTRNLALGDRAPLLSERNAENLAKAVAGAGMGVFGAELTSELETLGETFAKYAPAVRNATMDVFNQVGQQTVQAALDNSAPTPESIAAVAVGLVSSGGGAALSGAIRGESQELRTLLVAHATHNVVATAGRDFAQLGVQGLGDATGPELAKRFSRDTAEALVSAASSAIGDAWAARRIAVKEARADAGEEVEEFKQQLRRRTPEEEEQSVEQQRRRRVAEEDEPVETELQTPGRRGGGKRTVKLGEEAGYPDTLIHLGLKSREEAAQSYKKSIVADPEREAGVWYDPDAREFIVVQGNEGAVGHAWWRHSKELGRNRRWVLVEHYHPRGEQYLNRLPSPADFAVMLFDQIVDTRLGRAKPQAVNSRIRYKDAEGRFQTTEFGYSPELPEPYWVTWMYPDGTPGFETFKKPPWQSGSDYAAFLEKIGFKPKGGGGPLDLATPGGSTPVKPPPLPKQRPKVDPKLAGTIDEETAGAGGIESIRVTSVDGDTAFVVTGKILPTLYRGKGTRKPGQLDAASFNQAIASKSKLGSGTEQGLPTYEWSHIWGPVFGDEAAAGMLLAPAAVNDPHMKNIEFAIREMADRAAAAGAMMKVEATAVAWPAVTPSGWKARNPGPIVLKSARYEITVTLATGAKAKLRIGFDVTEPPNGRVVNPYRRVVTEE